MSAARRDRATETRHDAENSVCQVCHQHDIFARLPFD
jgi:hypothetical protein